MKNKFFQIIFVLICFFVFIPVATFAVGIYIPEKAYAKIPEAGKKLVTDYITNGRCFVTTKLQREGSDASFANEFYNRKTCLSHETDCSCKF